MTACDRCIELKNDDKKVTEYLIENSKNTTVLELVEGMSNGAIEKPEWLKIRRHDRRFWLSGNGDSWHRLSDGQ
jgi:hypothetical protein